jgi:hypothetical protein
MATTPAPVTLRATGDAYVRDSAYGMTNFGNATDLQVQRSPYASETRETFLKFDLTGVTQVSKVTLRLYGRLNAAGGGPATVVLDPVRDASWSETAITYNTRASTISGTTFGSVTVGDAVGRWYEWDVSAYVGNQWRLGYRSFAFAVSATNDTGTFVRFNSDEAPADQPQLVVAPTGGPTPPPEILLSTNDLTVPEGGTAPLSIRLSSKPAANVSITPYGPFGDTDLDYYGRPKTLVFTPTNWDQPQTLMFFAREDADAVVGTNAYTFGAPGLNTRSLVLREGENDGVGPPRTIRATADAFTRDGFTAGQNFGAAAQLEVKKGPTGYNRESVVTFDVAGVKPTTVAVVRLYGRLNNKNATAVSVDLFAASTTSWGESTVKWNNRPTAIGTTPLSSRAVLGTTGAWYEFDVTKYLNAQRAAGATRVSFLLRAHSQSDPVVVFDSDEGTNRPGLVVLT